MTPFETTTHDREADDGPSCFCGHTEGSHVDNIVGGAWIDYCLGCEDSEEDDNVRPAHLFEVAR